MKTRYILNNISVLEIVEKFVKTSCKGEKFVIQYADFNVLNYFYKNGLRQDNFKHFILYPDSSALYLYIKIFIKHDFKKIVSTNLQNELLVELNKESCSIFLFGDHEFILNNTIGYINKKFPRIKINGIYNGYNFNSDEVICFINESNVDVVFVGLGIGRQEKWIIENSDKINAKLLMSVGGWFQYLAGEKKRAPLILQITHLEWLHKLIVEFPRVWDRYLLGLPKFYFRLATKKIIVHLKDN